MPIKQFKSGIDNYVYVIYCEETKKAAMVDPSYNPTSAIAFLDSEDLKLEYIINTHHHWDHTSANADVKAKTGAKIVASKEDSKSLAGGADHIVSDGDIMKLGNIDLQFMVTPGHTRGGICIIVEDKFLLTGDTLFIGDCGRADLADGSLEEMFNSIQRIKVLPDELIVYPGHNYGPKPFDTLGNQKKTNKTLLAKTLEDFSKIT